MTRHSVAAVIRDPLKTYQFRLKMADQTGQYIAGVKTLSGLSVAVGAYEIHEGGNNLHRYAQPDKVTWDPLTLEQGLALDDTLELWARAVVDFARTGLPVSPVKRNVIIEVWDPWLYTASPTTPVQPTEDAHRPRVRAYEVFNAWISKYQALPRMDATASEVALIAVEIIHEGWRLMPPPTA